MIYLDSASTTFPKYTTYVCAWLNANTPYGVEMREMLKGAENSVKRSLGVNSGRVIFGGTASVMFKYLFDRISEAWIEAFDNDDVPDKAYHMMSSPYEHECIASHPVFIHNIEELCNKEAVKGQCLSETPIVFCQLVSNITGEVFPVVDIGTVAQELNGFFVCDMTASVGKYDIPERLEDFCDCVIASSHKLHGEKGQGFIWVSDRFNEWLNGIDYIGTPDITGALGTAHALQCSVEHYNLHYSEEWDNAVRIALFEQGVKYDTMSLSGSSDYTSDIVCLRIHGVYADALQNFLAEKKIYIGVGHSSCEDGENRYRVLMNGGYSEKEARECIRLSFDGGVTPTTQGEIDEFAKAVKEFIVTFNISQEKEEDENESN